MVFSHHNAHHFVSNSISFPLSVGVNQLKSQERFNLWTGLLYSSHKLRETKTLASSQGGDSSEKSGSESSSSQAPSQSTQSSGTGSGSGSSTNQKREKQNKSGGYWWSKGKKFQWQPIIQAQEIGVLLLQLGIVMFIMRLLRPGIQLQGSEPRTPTTFVSVPYIKFQESESFYNEDNCVHQYGSTDIRTPYEKMLDNQVEFGFPDKRSGGFLNSALIALFYVAVLAGLLHRFPVSFTQHAAG
ncbi:hypothetical protein QYF36_023353 [Acer negundo]|nr:hypothetical protein QYF36_023353 [Acer negundo]